MEYTVLGDAVNLSARLMANAPANGILVDEETRWLAPGQELVEVAVVAVAVVARQARHEVTPVGCHSRLDPLKRRTRCTVELNFEDLKPIKVKGALSQETRILLSGLMYNRNVSSRKSNWGFSVGKRAVTAM